MRKPFFFTLSVIITIVSFVLTSFLPGVVKPVYACYTWAVGQRVGLKGGTQIRTGAGFSYSVHTTLPADANNWQVDIIDGPRNVDGQEWWDISRRNIDGGGTGWVYKAQAGWDLCGTTPPGNIYVASGLELVPDPNHSWPPYEGDKLIGRFTLGNNGGQRIHLDGYGVRLRRNGSEYWDFLNNSGRDIDPNQTVRFDQNNERPLSTGHYRAEITWKVSGQDWQVSNAQEFDVVSRPAGNIYIASDIELQSDPNHTWPPYEGDKLIGRFTLGNNGGSNLRLDGLGIRMRRNSSEYWDFVNTSGFDLSVGQTIRFDQNNERPLASGHYRAEITWKISGQDWQVASAREFDVAPRPGSVYVASGLVLSSDPYHSWPPYEGDKLTGQFTLGNNGGSSIHLDGFGVRMRRNSSEYWDFLNTSGIDLSSGQTVQFNQNNERPLSTGHYRAEITWKVSGQDWQVADAIEFDVAARPTPGSITVSGGLELIPDPNLGWPPKEGNKLIGKFNLCNSGGQPITLDGFGIRMRRESSEYWDFLNTSGSTLSGGQCVSFNQNNERPLSAGHYRAEVTWKVSGQDWVLSNPTEFDVNVTQTGGSNTAVFVGQSNYPTVPADETFSIWFELKNTGTTTWSSAAGYQLVNANSQPLGAPDSVGVESLVLPNNSYRWTIVMHSPQTPGTYRTAWSLQQNGVRFGPYMYIDVTVPGTALNNAPDLRLVSAISVTPSSLTTYSPVQASFTVRNFGSTTAQVKALGVGGRGPGGESDIQDFTLTQGLWIAPGGEHIYTNARMFSQDGRYRFFPVYQTWDGVWHEIRGSAGENMSREVVINGQTSPSVRSLETIYLSSWTNKLVDVSILDYAYNLDGTTTATLRIKNKTKLALAFYFTDLGKPTYDENGVLGRPYIVVYPSDNSPEADVKITKILFRPESHLRIMVSALGMGNDDTGTLALHDTMTILCYSIIGDICPSGPINRAVATGDIFLMSIENSFKENAFAKISYKWYICTSQGCNWVQFGVDVTQIILEDMVSRNKFLFSYLFSKMGISVSAEVLSNLASAGIKLLFMSPKLYDFYTDIWDVQYWGNAAELDILPSHRVISGMLSSSSTEIPKNEQPSQQTVSAVDALPDTIVSQMEGSIVEGNQPVSASSSFGTGWETYRLFDNRTDVGWGNGGNISSSDQWVMLELAGGKPVNINQLIIHPGPTGGDPSDMALKDFYAEYSVDGVRFYDLYRGSFGLQEVGTYKTFTLPNPQLARFVKFHALSAQGSEETNYVSVGELFVVGDVGLPGDSFEPDDHYQASAPSFLPLSTSRHSFSFNGDKDWVHFVAQAGHHYVIETNNLLGGCDTVITLYKQDGMSVILSNDDFNGAARSKIEWSARANGTYYISIGNYDTAHFGEEVSYDLTIQDVSQMVYLPAITRGGTTIPSVQEVSGRITKQGEPLPGIELVMRLFDGTNYSTYATTITGPDGSYSFTSLPDLSGERRIYIRYNNGSGANPSNDQLLAYWLGPNIEDYSGQKTRGGDADLADMIFLSPLPGATADLPVTFQWNPRSFSPGDNYEVDFFDESFSNLVWYTNPLLGFTDQLTFASLPSSISPGVKYWWTLYLASPDGSYSGSYWSWSITFGQSSFSSFNSAQLSEVERLPVKIHNIETWDGNK